MDATASYNKPVTIFEWLSKQTKQKTDYVEPDFFDNYGILIGAFAVVAVIVGCTMIRGKKEKK